MTHRKPLDGSRHVPLSSVILRMCINIYCFCSLSNFLWRMYAFSVSMIQTWQSWDVVYENARIDLGVRTESSTVSPWFYKNRWYIAHFLLWIQESLILYLRGQFKYVWETTLVTFFIIQKFWGQQVLFIYLFFNSARILEIDQKWQER